jgi:hypothetical protein
MSLFVGGLHDGEWHRVERHLGHEKWPLQWSMIKRIPMPIHPSWIDPKQPVDSQSRVDHYNLFEFHVDGHTYHVYRHYKLKPHEAFEAILRGYQHKEIE